MNTQPESTEPPETDARPGMPPPATPSRPPVFNIHGAILMLSAVCIAVHVVRTQLLSDWLNTRFLVGTAFFPLRYSPEHFAIDLPTIFSPVTYSFVHGGWVHLIINIVWLAVFGSPLAYRIGWARSIGFWMVAAVAAAMTHLAVYHGQMVPVIGASGAVSGFMGAAARFGLRANRRHPRRGFDGPLLSIPDTFRVRGVVPFLLVWIALNMGIGFGFLDFADGAAVAWEAHIGGLVAGFLLVPLFVPQRRAG
jgi:membrane associated rhomboid family serine protease